MACTYFTEYFCYQCQRLVEEACEHFNDYPLHVLVPLTTASGLYNLVLYQSGYAEDIVAPEQGTATQVIQGFPTIEDAINYLVSSGVDAGMPTKNIPGFTTIEEAVTAIVTSGISSINGTGTPTNLISGYSTIESAIEDLQDEVEAARRVRNYSYSDEGGNIGLVNNSSSYKTVQIVLFEGSSVVGEPSEIKVVIRSSGGGNKGIRIVDITNNNTICELTGFSDSDYTIKDLGNISNISTGEAIWEIQLKKSYCAALSIKF